jgi:two-component system cell cycle response regulator DivK
MKAKILVIDDNWNNIKLIKLILEHAGFAVISATNGLEGVEIAVTEHPALILMDIQMPEKDGFQVAQELLADARTSHIPIIGMSAYATQSTRERGMRLGMVAFFEKPFNRELFIAQIMKFLPTVTDEAIT